MGCVIAVNVVSGELTRDKSSVFEVLKGTSNITVEGFWWEHLGYWQAEHFFV